MADIEYSDNVIDLKPAKTRKKRKIVLYLKLFAVLLWVVLMLLLADKYHYHYLNKPVVASAPAKTEVVSEPALLAAVPPTQTAPLQQPKFPMNDDADEFASDSAPAAAPVAQAPQQDLKPLENRIANLEAKNSNLLIYFAARDLKDSLDDPDNFKEQLGFLKKAIGSDLNVSGKIDILEQATGNGLVTRAKLLADLKILQKNVERSSGLSVKGAFDNLIKVSKIDGLVDNGDYNSILKRAEIALEKPKLSSQDLQAVIEDVKKTGKQSDDFIKETNNLQRVLEVVDFLIIYTKDKALGNNG